MPLIWLAQADLENAISTATVLALYDDGNGVVNAAAVNANLERAENEVLSWMVPEYGQSVRSDPTLATDAFLKYAALEYAVAHAFDRHPEYVRANGRERGERFERADARMQRVLQSRQQPPTLATRPANVGGVVTDGGSRLVIDNPDGTSNGGDF